MASAVPPRTPCPPPSQPVAHASTGAGRCVQHVPLRPQVAAHARLCAHAHQAALSHHHACVLRARTSVRSPAHTTCTCVRALHDPCACARTRTHIYTCVDAGIHTQPQARTRGTLPYAANCLRNAVLVRAQSVSPSGNHQGGRLIHGLHVVGGRRLVGQWLQVLRREAGRGGDDDGCDGPFTSQWQVAEVVHFDAQSGTHQVSMMTGVPAWLAAMPCRPYLMCDGGALLVQSPMVAWAQVCMQRLQAAPASMADRWAARHLAASQGVCATVGPARAGSARSFIAGP